MQRVKTEGVRESVERLNTVYNKLMKQRGEIHAEYRARLNAAEKEADAASNKFIGRVDTSESRMLEVWDEVSVKLAEQGDALGQVQRKLADQDKALSVLVASPPPAQEPVEGPDSE